MSRHSSFSRSSAPRPWRSVSKPAGPSVSLVFAEPEHAEPVGSAAAMLSPRRQSTEAEDVEESTPERRRPDAASSLRKASYASLRGKATRPAALGDTATLGATSNGNTRSETEISRTSSPQPISDGNIREPDESGPKVPPSQPTPQRTGWFGSLSRKPQQTVPIHGDASGNAEMMSVQENGSSKEITRPESPSEVASQPPPALDSNQTSVQTVPFPTVDVMPTSEVVRKSSPPQDIPQKKSTGWFSGVGSSASTRQTPTANPSVPSSVDDNVPTLSSFTSPSSSPPPAAQVRPRERTNSNLSSLNPSSSRFTLSMPLLGRPKVPLDQVVSQVERAGATGELPQDVTAPVPATIEKSIQDSDSGKTPRADAPSENSSWWGYIGLGSSSSVDVSSSPALEPSPVLANTESVPPPLHDPVTQPAPSVTSTETSHTQSSAWYTPWRWYGGTAVPTSIPPENDGKTQAEIVKEEALARPEPSPEPPAPQTEPSNPLISNPENRASWVSFFSSRSATTANVKSVKEKGEIMEVMDIDSDEENASSQPSGSGGATPKKKAPPSPLKPGTPKPEQEPPKRSPNHPPLTKDEAVKHQVSQRPSSPSSKKSVPPVTPRLPNLVLPTFEDTFGTPPRSIPLPKDASTIRRTIRYMSEILFPEEERRGKGRGKGKEHGTEIIGRELPRTWAVLGDEAKAALGGLTGLKRVVVIGIHGWFPGSIIRQVLGEPTGTSGKFASMMAAAIEKHFAMHDCTLEKLTKIVLEGEGTIEQRVNNLYQEFLHHEDWIEDLHKADAIFVATHSQGSIVSTQLLDRLITEGHIRTQMAPTTTSGSDVPVPVPMPMPMPITNPQRVCCLAMCGIHLGPLVYLNTSSLVNPYLQYFESAAARELFEFQDSESQVSKTYVKALSNVLAHGTKFTYIASMNDQVVPIYSGSFTTAAHPLILRALYIDGDAYSSSDFLSNLLVLLLRIRSCGLDDGGLITHLSEATAGSLSGVGHSAAYEEPATYALAVRFLFETSGVLGVHSELEVQPFTARAARNDYEIPWALRDMIANPDVAALFTSEFSELRAAFDDWHPRTTILRDLRRKLEPIRRLPTSRL